MYTGITDFDTLVKRKVTNPHHVYYCWPAKSASPSFSLYLYLCLHLHLYLYLCLAAHLPHLLLLLSACTAPPPSPPSHFRILLELQQWCQLTKWRRLPERWWKVSLGFLFERRDLDHGISAACPVSCELRRFGLRARQRVQTRQGRVGTGKPGTRQVIFASRCGGSLCAKLSSRVLAELTAGTEQRC